MVDGVVIVFVILVGLVAVALLEFGYRRGVKETEKRWSDAVTRADYHRKQEADNG